MKRYHLILSMALSSVFAPLTVWADETSHPTTVEHHQTQALEHTKRAEALGKAATTNADHKKVARAHVDAARAHQAAENHSKAA